MNKFLIFFVLALAALFFVGGCGQTTGTGGNETASGTGTAGIGGTGTGTGAATDWCKAGSAWDWSGATSSGQGQVKMVIRGLEQYKGSTYCHATIETTAGQEQGTIEYYFVQENNNVTDMWMVIKDSTGKVLGETHTTA